MSTALPRRTRISYGLGSVATGSFAAVPGLLLLPYLTDRLGISAAIAGLLVFLPKFWDVFFNPIAGRISDNSRHPDGPRRPFLLRGGLTLAVLFALLFFGPQSPPVLASAWVVVVYLACATAYAFFQVPYVAMPAELTDDYDERTRLMTWRVAILALSILVSGGLSPLIRNQLGYPAVGIFVGALIAVGALSVWKGTATASMRPASGSTSSFTAQLRTVAADRPFCLLVAAFVIQALATGMMLAGADYVARTVLGRPGMSSVLFVCFVGPALLVTPLWERYAVSHDKRRGFLLAGALLALGAFWTTFALGL